MGRPLDPGMGVDLRRQQHQPEAVRLYEPLERAHRASGDDDERQLYPTRPRERGDAGGVVGFYRGRNIYYLYPSEFLDTNKNKVYATEETAVYQ